MDSRCTICTHDNRAAIDAAIIRADSMRRIELDHGVSLGAIQRHKRHMAAAVDQARAELLPAVAQRLEQHTLVLIATTIAGELVDDARQLYLACVAARNVDGAVSALYVRIKALEVAHALGCLSPPDGPGRGEDIGKVVAAIERALRPYGDARQAVADAMEGL